MHNVGVSWAYGAGLNYSPRGGEGPAKTTGTADLDDPVHPTARWRTQRANPQTRILRRTQEGGKCHRRSTSPGCQCPTSPVWSRAGAHANTNHHLVRKLFVAKVILPRSKSLSTRLRQRPSGRRGKGEVTRGKKIPSRSAGSSQRNCSQG